MSGSANGMSTHGGRTDGRQTRGGCTMSTGRTTDDRDRDYARHKEVMRGIYDTNQLLLKLGARCDRIETRLEALEVLGRIFQAPPDGNSETR